MYIYIYCAEPPSSSSSPSQQTGEGVQGFSATLFFCPSSFATSPLPVHIPFTIEPIVENLKRSHTQVQVENIQGYEQEPVGQRKQNQVGDEILNSNLRNLCADIVALVSAGVDSKPLPPEPAVPK